MASALVQLEQPQRGAAAFAEAAALGAPEAEIAGDRGLAYDMLGDPRARAAGLCAGAAPPRRSRGRAGGWRCRWRSAASATRRCALIDAQLRGHDRAAWRTQAFVLALTGDAAGADRDRAQT